MRAYELFKQPERGFQAVRRGFSWPGFLFSGLWALSRRLWLIGIPLVVVELGLAWFAWQTYRQNGLFPLGLAFLLHLVVGWKVNFWASRNLEDQGCRYVGAINARDTQDAISKVTATGGVIAKESKALSQSTGLFGMPPTYQALFALVTLTWKAAFRYKLFWVLAFLLLGSVVGLPLLIKDDGTADGFTQILLTYTLSAVTGILGLCTLWLACGTLARDIEDCQMQMVVVKPIPRWQVWLGKWLGLLTLNATLLALAGLGIYGLLEWRAKQLPKEQQVRLQNEVLVARASIKEDSWQPKIDEQTEIQFNARLKKNLLQDVDLNVAKRQMRTEVKAQVEAVAPDGWRPWVIHLGALKDSLRGQPLFLRIKFNTADMSEFGTFGANWLVGTPQKTRIWESQMASLSPNTFHEFPIPADLIDDKGDLNIVYINPNNVPLIFPLDEGMEVLYREGGFGLNYVRGLAIILCWMTLLATLGLAAASLLSFPVAAFFSLAVLAIGLSSGTLSNVVSEGTLMGYNEESGAMGHSAIDTVAVPIFRGMLDLIQLVQQFSPIDALSSGRSITWTQLGMAVTQIIFVLGGIIAAAGIFTFNRREMATAQGTT